MQPSSPNRPCSARKATSAPAPRMPANQSPRMSIWDPAYPFRRRACAAAPPVRSDTSRSEDSPPRNPPTVFPRYLPFSGIEGAPQFDFECKVDPRHHPYLLSASHDEPERFGGGCPPRVDQEIGVLLREKGIALPRALHPCLLQQPARFLVRRIAEGRAEGPLPPGLGRAALLVQRFHPGEHLVRNAGGQSEAHPGDYPPHGERCLAVRKPDVVRNEPVQSPFGVHDFHPLRGFPRELRLYPPPNPE